MSLTDIRVASKSLPIVRYVYLVQDTADLIRMGGVPGNTYTTFQAAYNAANTLQLTLGGTNRVVIMVGNTTAAAVGNIVLTANWNEAVWVQGLSFLNSEVGNITGDNAAGAGFSVGRSLISQQVGFSNVKVGNISTSATGGASNSGAVNIAGSNTWFGNINTSITNAANTTGTGGAVRFQFNTNQSHLILGTITTSSQATTSLAGVVTIICGSLSASSITTANNNLSGAITITPFSGAQLSSINVNSTGSSGNVSIKRTTITSASSITFVSNSASFTDCDIVDLVVTDPSGSSNATFTRSNVEDYTSNVNVETNALNCVFKTITSLGNSSILSSTSVNTMGTAVPCINGIGTGCLLKNVSLIGGSFSITNGGVAVTVESDQSVFDASLGSDVIVEVNGGVPLISSGGTGTFTFDCSKYKAAKIELDGDAGGSASINFDHASIGEKYTLYVQNNTGTDTLLISVTGGGVVFEGGVVYVPTIIPGAYDKLEISCGFGGVPNLFIDPFFNYS